jgi:hypothetical protein
MRRPLFVAVATTAVAGVLLLFTSGRTWGAATVGGAGAARQHVSVSGHAVAPALSALGLALLAMSVALIAGRGPLRRIAGLLVVVIGAATIAVAVQARNDVGPALAVRVFATSARSVGGSRAAWWLVAAVAGAVAAVAGAAVTLGAGRRAGLGARYDAPTTAPSTGSEPVATPVDAWDAIEQGQDPTEGQ